MESEHKLSDYNFEFPKELIASRTAGKGKTRILHCPKDGGERRIMKAPEIVELFRPGDCLVVNNTKVIPARLYGHTLHGGEVETLLVQALIPAENGEARYEAQVRPGKAFKIGRELEIAGVKTVVEDVKEDGARVLRFAVTPVELEAVMNREGHVPLPPYIDRPDDEDDKGGGIVLEYVGNMGPVPMAAYAFHHLCGGEPGLLVGFGGVEVGAAAEEEAGEADEDKGEEGVPDQGEGVFERRGVVAFWEEGGDDGAVLIDFVEHGDGNGDDQDGEKEHAEEWAGIDGVGGTDEDVAKHHQDDAQQGRFVFP